MRHAFKFKTINEISKTLSINERNVISLMVFYVKLYTTWLMEKVTIKLIDLLYEYLFS